MHTGNAVDRIVLKPIFQRGRKRAVWMLLRSYSRMTIPLGTVTVQPGFVSDLASIPWFLRWLYPPDGIWGPAAVVHDWLYSQPEVSRRVADRIFWDHMREDGVPWFRAMLFYWGVRLFGRWHKATGERLA